MPFQKDWNYFYLWTSDNITETFTVMEIVTWYYES